MRVYLCIVKNDVEQWCTFTSNLLQKLSLLEDVDTVVLRNELAVVKITATGTGVSESGADVSLKPQVVDMLGPGRQVKRLLRVQRITILALNEPILPTGTFRFLIYSSLTTVTTCPFCRQSKRKDVPSKYTSLTLNKLENGKIDLKLIYPFLFLRRAELREFFLRLLQ